MLLRNCCPYHHLKRGILSALSLLLLTAPVGKATSLDTAGKIKVVASIFPLADLVRQIGGKWVDVETLLPSGASPHTFEPTPRQFREFSRAGIFVRVGAGLEMWAEKMLLARRTPPILVTATEEVTLLRETTGVGGEKHGDPHVWLDPVLVREQIIPQIADRLIQLAPQHKSYFQERTKHYLSKLEELDRDFKQRTTRWSHRKFIVFHSSWRYFAQRYGLEEMVAILESPGKEPSARWIARMVDLARKYQITIVFTEPQFNPRPAQVVAQELGGRVLVLDPLGGEGLPGRNNYLGLMRYNVETLEEALR